MSGAWVAPRIWRSIASVNGMSLASPARTVSGAVDVLGRADRLEARVRVEPEPRVGAQRARVLAGGDQAALGAVGVRVAALEDRSAEPLRLDVGADVELGQDPDVVAAEGEPAGGQALFVLGDPAALGVGQERVAVAPVRQLHVGPRLDRVAAPAVEVVAHLDHELRDRLDVLVAHRADLHAAKTTIVGAMSSFSIDGQRLAYTEYGSGPRLTVLLHGLLFNQRMHDALARALAARGHRVVTLDLLGHGDSDRPREKWRYSMPQFGAQVIALLDELDAPEAVVMGTSLGANVALEASVRAPERVRGMVIEMPVLDHALIGCAIAFTPIMVALTAGEPAMRGLSRGDAARCRAGGCRGRPTSCSTGCARTPSRAPRCSRACSSGAPRRRARSGCRSRRPRWSSAISTTSSTRSRTPGCSPPSCRMGGFCRHVRCSSCASRRAG